MKEINYQVFDKVSGLPVEDLSDKMVRDFASSFGRSCSSMFNEFKENLDKQGILYLVILENKKVKVIPKCNISSYKAEKVVSFEDYQDALNFVEKNK